jgi:hypothetical protein
VNCLLFTVNSTKRNRRFSRFGGRRLTYSLKAISLTLLPRLPSFCFVSVVMGYRYPVTSASITCIPGADKGICEAKSKEAPNWVDLSMKEKANICPLYTSEPATWASNGSMLLTLGSSRCIMIRQKAFRIPDRRHKIHPQAKGQPGDPGEDEDQ